MIDDEMIGAIHYLTMHVDSFFAVISCGIKIVTVAPGVPLKLNQPVIIGCVNESEPSTAALLLNQFTPMELRSLCPKNASAANKARSAAIYAALTKLASLPADAPNVDAVVLAIKRIISAVWISNNFKPVPAHALIACERD